jgi:Ca2+-binding RTX toxin-like protein
VALSEALTLPAGVSIVSITPGGATAYAPPNGASGVWTVGALPAGQNRTLTVVLTVGGATAAGANVVSSATSVTDANEGLINPLDDSATQSTTVAAPAMALDFGDAPASYGTLLAANGARHGLSSNLRLGATVDAETNGNPTANSTGDDASATDDEDGVVLPTMMIPGMSAIASVTASAAGRLDAWIDFNRNGIFDAGEQIAVGLLLNAGANNVAFVVPAAAVTGLSQARFRLSSAGGLGPTGEAVDGEVEDYALTIASPAPDTAILVDDPTNPNKKMLVVTGTGKNDDIQIQLNKNGVVLCRRGCRIAVYSASSIGRIVIFGSAGNDKLKAPTNLNMPVEMYGGAGNDTLTGTNFADLLDGGTGNDKLIGGAGNDLLLGGDGKDNLTGGAGRDVLIGGRGVDTLLGQDGDDILIGGATAHDSNTAALNQIMAAWGDPTADFNLRIAGLGGLLNPLTVNDDGSRDTLDGGKNRDWLLDFLLAETIKSFVNDPLLGDKKN